MINITIIEKIIKHFCLVTKHRYIVFKLCIKSGIPFRGFVHDLSKYSPTEFIESVKYYNGKKSPINICKEEKGYSLAWLHHKAKNKHHLEYWEDCVDGTREGAFLPYKYMAEMICDRIAAGIVYKGTEWSKEQPLDYWINVDRKKPIAIHPKTDEFILTVFEDLSEYGIDSVINKKYLRNTYLKIHNSNKAKKKKYT